MQVPTKKMKRFAWAKEYTNWALPDCKRVMFSDEIHFFVGSKHSRFVRKSLVDSVTTCRIKQQAKHPPKNVLGML